MCINSTVWLKESDISMSGWNHGDCICIIKAKKMALGEHPSPNRNCAYWSKLFEKSKNGNNIFVGQAVLQLLIKKLKKILFWSITKVKISVWPTKMLVPIWVLRQIASGCLYHFSKKCYSFGIENTTCSFSVWGSVPPTKQSF